MKKLFKNKKVISFILVLAMVFAMSATAFADTNVTVHLTLDTQAYDLNSVMKHSNSSSLGGSVVKADVTVPVGSTVWDVINKAADDLNMDLVTGSAVYGGTTGYYVTDIANVGPTTSMNTYTTTQKQNTFTYFGGYLMSGWVYSIDGNYPSYFANQMNVTDGMNIKFAFTVTGPYDLNTNNYTGDYSNPDRTFWDMMDKLQAKIAEDPTSDAAVWGQYVYDDFISQIQDAKTNTSNQTGLGAYYGSHTNFTESYGPIDTLRDTLYLFD